MDRHPPQRLTTAEAKARLRLAAYRASPVGWLRQHPLKAAGSAAAAGFLLGRDPRIVGLVTDLLAPEVRRLLAARRPR